MYKLILASTSPRRIELIKQLGIKVQVVQPDSDESTDEPNPRKYAETLAERKAKSVAHTTAKDAIIGADTIVVLDGKILGKPKNADDALYMLKSLGGRAHNVITGVCVCHSGKAITRSDISTVHFLPFDERVARAYIATGKCYDKAGAYGAQDDEAPLFIEKIDGDVTNVIGLPLGLLKKMLDEID